MGNFKPSESILTSKIKEGTPGGVPRLHAEKLFSNGIEGL